MWLWSVRVSRWRFYKNSRWVSVCYLWFQRGITSVPRRWFMSEKVDLGECKGLRSGFLQTRNLVGVGGEDSATLMRRDPGSVSLGTILGPAGSWLIFVEWRKRRINSFCPFHKIHVVFWQLQNLKEMGGICPQSCSPRWLSWGYQALLMIDCAFLYSDDPFSGSKSHNLQVALYLS